MLKKYQCLATLRSKAELLATYKLKYLSIPKIDGRCRLTTSLFMLTPNQKFFSQGQFVCLGLSFSGLKDIYPQDFSPRHIYPRGLLSADKYPRVPTPVVKTRWESVHGYFAGNKSLGAKILRVIIRQPAFCGLVCVCLKKPFFLLFQAKIETKALKAKRPGFTDDRYHETEYYVENGKLYFIPSLFAGPFPLHFHSASSTINYALGVKKCTRKAPVRLLEWASQPRL